MSMLCKSRLWISVAFLAALLTGYLSSIVSPAAAGTLDEIKARGKLIAGVKGDYPPFGYFDKQGKHVGFDVDIAHMFAKALLGDENKVELVPLLPAARIPALQTKKVDVVIASMGITNDRKKLIDFSDPYFLSGLLMLVPRNSTIANPNDLMGKAVGVIRSSTTEPAMKALAPRAEHVGYDKVDEALYALRAGQIDVFAFDDVLILTLAHENPDLKTVWDPFNPAPFGIGVRKGETEFLAWVNQQLATMRTNGSYDALWEKHLGAVEAKLMRLDTAKAVPAKTGSK